MWSDTSQQLCEVGIILILDKKTEKWRAFLKFIQFEWKRQDIEYFGFRTHHLNCCIIWFLEERAVVL